MALAALKASNSLFSSSSIRTKSALSIPSLPKIRILPSEKPTYKSKLIEKLSLADSNGFLKMFPLEEKSAPIKEEQSTSSASKSITDLYSVLESVIDRIEMHKNIGEQRDNWNTLLLNSINMITLAAATMAGIAAATHLSGSCLLGLKLSSTLFFSAATGMLLIMNKIQPSQLVEEQRNATRLFTQLKTKIQTTLAIGVVSQKDVKEAIKRVLALDRAYPLPLIGAMLEKFPQKFQPAKWWPESKKHQQKSFKTSKKTTDKINGWDQDLEFELKEVVQVMKRKDIEDYERLGNIALKVNKALAISGPLLTAMAAIGSICIGQAWAPVVAMSCGALATIVNTLEHGGQVGMVFEMYRNTAGFFSELEESIESTVGEMDENKRENGELFELKVAMKLGRSLSQLRDLARKSRRNQIDEFACKLF